MLFDVACNMCSVSYFDYHMIVCVELLSSLLNAKVLLLSVPLLRHHSICELFHCFSIDISFCHTERLQRESEELAEAAELAQAEREKNAQIRDIGREMDTEAMNELNAMRTEWMQQTLDQTIENVLEQELLEALIQAVASIEYAFDVRILTAEERIAQSKAHMVLCLQEKVKHKRHLGKRIGFMA